MNQNIIVGHSLHVLRGVQDCHFTAAVTDPPYGLISPNVGIASVLSRWLVGDYEVKLKGGFMGKRWDSFVPPPNLWAEVYRVLKPGGTLLCFSGTRTMDLMGLSLRLGGFVIRDVIGWAYASGFPKAYDIAKGIEGKLTTGSANWSDFKKLPGEKGVLSMGYTKTQFEQGYRPADYSGRETTIRPDLTTPQSQQWDGQKSHALKPAYEPIIIAQKPNDGSYVDNALNYGVSGLNIDGTRTESGHYPSNLIVDEYMSGYIAGRRGGDSSMFYCPKPSRNEKNAGVTLPPRQRVYNGKSQASSRDMKDVEKRFTTKPAGNHHPTVKPVELMSYLIRLVKQPGDNLVLDPFLGSGTTGVAAIRESVGFVGIELSEEYAAIARQRMAYEGRKLI